MNAHAVFIRRGHIFHLLVIYAVVAAHDTVYIHARREELHGVVVLVLDRETVARPFIVGGVHRHIELEAARYRVVFKIIRENNRLIGGVRGLNLAVRIFRHLTDL